jgi:predicted GIY-YIG superfamily endonuclease
MSAWFYVLRLQSGSLYPGTTADLKRRYEEHCTKRACRTTTLDPPAALVYSEEYETFSEARRREAQVKRWSRAKKEALVSGNLSSLRNPSKSKWMDVLRQESEGEVTQGETDCVKGSNG